MCIRDSPRDAYWSPTDRDTIACYTGLLEKAAVLGHDHYKTTCHTESPISSLEPEGPLSSWTSEPTVLYSDDPQTLSRNGRAEEDEE